MKEFNLDNVKKAVLEKVNLRPIIIRCENNDFLWNENNHGFNEGHVLSKSDCIKCALEIAKTVYLESMKGR